MEKKNNRKLMQSSMLQKGKVDDMNPKVIEI